MGPAKEGCPQTGTQDFIHGRTVSVLQPGNRRPTSSILRGARATRSRLTRRLGQFALGSGDRAGAHEKGSSFELGSPRSPCRKEKWRVVFAWRSTGSRGSSAPGG